MTDLLAERERLIAEIKRLSAKPYSQKLAEARGALKHINHAILARGQQ